jgi:hypothetical protein
VVANNNDTPVEAVVGDQFSAKIEVTVEIGYHANAKGTATIHCHLHGTADLDARFPPNQHGLDGTHDIRVKA